jgi:hypothetical protein
VHLNPCIETRLPRVEHVGGAFGAGPRRRNPFRPLGRHDEFTPFCSVAIANASEDHDEALNFVGIDKTRMLQCCVREIISLR